MAILLLACGAAACRSGEAVASLLPARSPAETPDRPGVLPPRGAARRIVFDMPTAAGGPRDIYLAQLDGAGLVRLTFDSVDHHTPVARGGTVYFGSTRRDGTVLAAVRLAESDAAGWTIEPGDAPTLSPDGTMLAYLSTTGPLPRVWFSRSDGSGAQRLAAAEAGWDGAVEAHPAWSPQGDRIAYVSTRNGNAEIFVGAIDGPPGSATVVAAARTGASLEPAWSPEGLRIVFSSDRDGSADLYTVTLASGAVTRLTTMGHVGQPVWLRDDRIVFTHWQRGVAALAWLDPRHPATIHPIATAGDAQHAAAYP